MLISESVVLAGAFALCKLFTMFMPYDDEGYLLLSLKHYLSEGRLYTDTYAQYGPFYYFAQGIFFQVFHVPVSHDGGRLVTLVYWLGAGLLAGLFIEKLSNSLLLGCTAALACIMVGGVALANEPGHPQQIVLLLWMAASYLSILRLSERTTWRLFVLGAIGAALIFTKINIGVFYIAALAHALFCIVKPGWIRSLGLSLTIVYAIAAPWFLMHADFQRGALDYCLLAILCGASTFVFGSLLRPAYPQSARYMLVAGSGLLAGSLLIVIAAALQGISQVALIRGVILDPMKLSEIFFVPLKIDKLPWMAATLVTAVLICVWHMRRKPKRLAFGVGVDATRVALGLGIILSLMGGVRHIAWFLPFLPLSLLPGARQSLCAIELFPRLFITCMAATQFLEAYPVAGSQVAIAASPILLWAFVCVVDGIGGLRVAWHRYGRAFLGELSLEEAVGSLLWIAAVATIAAFSIRPLRYLPPPSVLAGSSLLHLDPEQERDYEFIARSVGANCKILFTMPGMGSFNFWSGVPTPNGSNHSAWMKGLSGERQQQILSLLQSTPDSCVVYNPELVSFWQMNEEEITALPLAHYIVYDMQKVAARGAYEIRIHPERKSAWRSGGS